jgi:hypothetical protein
MSDHVLELLGAYLDGELHGAQLRKVITHLEECQVCQEEEQSLLTLSATLQGATRPDFPSPERFARDVELLLPRAPVEPAGHKVLAFGWWLAPVGLILAWVFLSTTLLVSNVVTTAGQLGLLDSFSAWPASGSGVETSWSGMLVQLGLLSGNGQQWAELTEAFTRTSLPQMIWQVAIALLYLSWMAIWWARQTLQGHGQPFESGIVPEGGSRPTVV